MTGPPREVPIQDSTDINKPLITTTAKVITWLSALIVLVIALSGWAMSNRFETVVESRFDKFELRLSREYASKADTLSKTEYQVRHAEVETTMKQIADRMTEDERRLNDMSGRVLQLERAKK